MIEAHAEVLVKGMSGLLEVMEGAVGKLSPQLVVMGSAALTMHNLSTASVMGSVTLSVLKRVSLPTLVVTCNSKHLVATGRRECGGRGKGFVGTGERAAGVGWWKGFRMGRMDWRDLGQAWMRGFLMGRRRGGLMWCRHKRIRFGRGPFGSSTGGGVTVATCDLGQA